MAAPKIIPFNVELRSVNPVRSFDRPKAYTNDLNSVEFQFKILDMTSTELTTATAVTLVYMRDGSFFANPSTDVSRVGNVFSYLLKENEGNHAGVAQIQLVVMVDGMELASQLFDFEIINGLETKVAQEVMIYDWTTLTRDARAYIDQFVADEVLRDAQFDNAQFDRNASFGVAQVGRVTAFDIAQNDRTEAFDLAQTQRNTDFGAAQTSRGNAYVAAELARDDEFDETEALRAAGYLADHNRAGTDHTAAAADHTLAGTDHTTAASDHTLAGTDHTRAETDHTRADADSATVGGYNTRLVEVETDTSFDVTNLFMNPDFEAATGWLLNNGGSGSVTANEYRLITSALATSVGIRQVVPLVANRKYYVSIEVNAPFNNQITIYKGVNLAAKVPVPNTWERLSAIYNSILTESASVVFVTATTTQYAIDSILKFRKANIIDLTTIFGAGKEPTTLEMDRILARFTNSWFGGTKNLFAAKNAIEKQMQLDSGAIMEGSNLLVNGDLSNGTTGWQPNSATIAVANGILSVTGSGSFTHATVFQDSVKQVYIGQKIYTRAKVKVTNSAATSFKILLQGSVVGGTAMDLFSKSSPMLNEQFTASGIATITDQTGVVRIVFRGQYVDAATAVGKTYELSYINTIDLTATFGLGNEPTLEQMDAILAKFENSWFDGTKNLFQAKASLSKLMALDARTEFEMKNEVVNGDFSNGSTGWTLHSTASIINGVVNSVPTADAQNSYQYVNALPNRKYYIRGLVTGVSGFTLIPEFRDATSSYGLGQFIGASVPSAIINTPSLTTQIRLYLANNTARGTGTFDNITLIDLTAAFGAGKEPTLAEMDRLMARFPNSWFDGVKPIQTIENLYFEKAGKTQEAWITPSLLNGWTEVAGYPVRYMKDELGFVHIKGRVTGGTVGLRAFTLPSGYRTASPLFKVVLTNDLNVIHTCQLQNEGAVAVVSGTGTNIALEGIPPFRAEV